VRQLEDAVRWRITTMMRADAARFPPIVDGRRYPAVLCCFCPDSITDDLAEWERYTHNVASLVDDGGWFVLTALAGARAYRVGGYEFPSPRLDADHVYRALRGAGFAPRATTVVSAAVADPDWHGFDSVLFAIARRR
jgi:hypothetical protein